MIDKSHSIFLFKARRQEKTVAALSPSRLKMSDYFLYSIVLYFRSKTFFKRKQSQNTQQVEHYELFETRCFCGVCLKIIQKQGDYSR